MAKYTIQEVFSDTQTIHWHAVERADRNMKKHGRAKWNDEDEAIYFANYYRVLEMVAGPSHPAVIQYKRDMDETAGIGHNGGPAL